MATEVGGIYYTVSADTRPLIDQQRVVDRETQRMAASFNAITAAIKVLVTAMALVKAAQMADDMRLLGARVQVAAGSIEAGAAALDELRKIAARTQTELAANAAVFNRLNQSILQMGGTQRDTLQITELLGKAIKVSGASGVEAASAMTQFGQALGSGKLAGDELRSLLENAPYLMRQLADGLGVPIGALKQLGEDGKLTADVVVNALSKAAGQIEVDFKRMPQTVSGAFSLVRDAAARTNEALDTATGSSAALAGASQGLAEVLNRLADQFNEANKAATGLSRSEQVQTWAGATRMALSYVADAADVTWQTLSVLGRNVAFVFESVGAEIGGIGAQVMAVLRGDFGGAREIGRAMEADAAERRRRLDAADARTLADRKTWGQAMRDTWAQAVAEDRGFTPSGQGGGRLKPPAMPVDEEKAKRDAQRLADARTKAYIEASEAERRIMEEQDKLTQQFYEEQQRKKEKAEEEERKAAEQRSRGQGMARGILGQGDELVRLQQELEAKKAMLAEFAAEDKKNEELYAAARVALEEQTQARIREIVSRENAQKLQEQQQMLGAYGNLFGSLGDLAEASAGKQSAAYKAMFVAQKAFAIASAIVNIQKGISDAAAQGATWQQKLMGMATVASATAGIVSTIRGVEYGGGRMYGGPTDAGSLYQVNEQGRPELFRGADGSQYMLPTQRGSVVPADQVGGGVQLRVEVINQHGGAAVAVRQADDGRTTQIVISEVAAQISERRGPVWNSLRGTTNVQPRN